MEALFQMVLSNGHKTINILRSERIMSVSLNRSATPAWNGLRGERTAWSGLRGAQAYVLTGRLVNRQLPTNRSMTPMKVLQLHRSRATCLVLGAQGVRA